MKKALSLLLAGVVLALPLTACSNHEQGNLVKSQIEDVPAETTKVAEPVQDEEPADNENSDDKESTAVSEAAEATESDTATDDDKVIRLWSFTNELEQLSGIFLDLHPDFEYTFESSIYASDNDSYESALNNSLITQNGTQPDIFTAEAEFVINYTQGFYSKYVASYEDLGIDVEQAVIDAEIAPYAVEIGTRESDGKIVGLSYTSTACVMYYRASIAEDTWGTSDPDEIKEIIGGGSGSWDKFKVAAQDLKDKGYVILPGMYDIYMPFLNCTSESWLVDREIVVSEEREAYIDLCKEFIDNDYTYNDEIWLEDWYMDTTDTDERPGSFAFFGPSWMGDNVIAWYCGDTFGDWRITEAPRNFYWGGTWVMPTTYATTASPEKQAAIAEFLEWLTLDTTEDGAQYLLANYYLSGNEYTMPVTSNVVMAISDGESALLDYQNKFDVFIEANKNTHNTNISLKEFTLGQLWVNYVSLYVNGKITRDEIYDQFSVNAMAELGMI